MYIIDKMHTFRMKLLMRGHAGIILLSARLQNNTSGVQTLSKNARTFFFPWRAIWDMWTGVWETYTTYESAIRCSFVYIFYVTVFAMILRWPLVKQYMLSPVVRRTAQICLTNKRPAVAFFFLWTPLRKKLSDVDNDSQRMLLASFTCISRNVMKTRLFN